MQGPPQSMPVSPWFFTPSLHSSEAHSEYEEQTTLSHPSHGAQLPKTSDPSFETTLHHEPWGQLNGVQQSGSRSLHPGKSPPGKPQAWSEISIPLQMFSPAGVQNGSSFTCAHAALQGSLQSCPVMNLHVSPAKKLSFTALQPSLHTC